MPLLSPPIAKLLRAAALAVALVLSLGAPLPANAATPENAPTGLLDRCPGKWPVPVNQTKISFSQDIVVPSGSLFLCRSKYVQRKVLVNTTDAAWNVKTNSRFPIKPVSSTGQTSIFRAAMKAQGYETRTLIAPHETVRIPWFTTKVTASAKLEITTMASVLQGFTEEIGVAATKKMVAAKSPTYRMVLTCAETATSLLEGLAYDNSTTTNDVLKTAFGLSSGVGKCQEAWDARVAKTAPGEVKLPTWEVFVSELAESKSIAGLERALVWVKL
jgi:hypothetical protein